MQFAGTPNFRAASPSLGISLPRSVSSQPYGAPITRPNGIGYSNNVNFGSPMPRGAPIMPTGIPYPSVGPYSIPFAIPQGPPRIQSPYGGAGLPMQYPGISLGPPPALPGMYRGLPFGVPLNIGSKDHLVPSYVGYQKLNPSEYPRSKPNIDTTI